jgi:hypothetical protein
MAKMFKAKLTPDHPYVGYTLFSNTPNIFESNTEYLARGDGKSISGNYAINLNGIYESAFTEIDYNKSLSAPATYGRTAPLGRHVRDYLACAALAQNESGSGGGICDSGNYFNHYTVVNSSNAPYTADITLPFSVNSSSNRYYINYMAFGYSRSNTPYVGLGSFMTPGTMLSIDLKDQNYYYGNGDVLEESSTGMPLYTYKGCGVWSTDMCDQLCHDFMESEIGSSYHASVAGVGLFSNNGYSNAEGMINAIGQSMGSYLSAWANVSGYGNYHPNRQKAEEAIGLAVDTLNVFLGGHYGYAGKNKFCLVGYNSAQGRLVYYRIWISPSYMNENPSNGCVFQVTANYSDGSGNGHSWSCSEYYKVLYEEDYEHYDSELGDIDDYLLGTGTTEAELIYTGSKSTITEDSRGFGFDAGDLTYSFPITGASGMYTIFPIVRLTGPYIATSSYLYNSIFGRKFVDSLGKVEKGKFNRFDAAVLSGGRTSLQKGVTLAGGSVPATGTSDSLYTTHKTFGLSSVNKCVPNRQGSRGTHYIGLLNQFIEPNAASTAGGYNFGFLSSAKSTPSGSIYVRTLRIKLEGDTTTFANNIIIYGPSSNTIIKLSEGGVYSAALGYTTYTVNFTSTTSVSYIKAVTNAANTKYCMDAKFCGLQQMIRSCSANQLPATGDYATKYSSIFSSDARSKASQWSAAKIYGYISFSVSGGNQYAAEDESATNTVTIIGAEIEIADESSVVITTNKASLREGTIEISDTYFPMYNGRYALSVREEGSSESTTVKSPFLYSMSGKPTANGNSYLYEDSSTFNLTFTTENFPTLLPISTGSITVAGTECGSYKNNFGSDYTGKAFANSKVIEATATAASSDVFATGAAATTCINNYSIINTITESTSSALATEFNKKNVIECKLPTPGLLSKLVYESVEFNGASAWTFTRSMPLEPASASNPHILLYRIEAWIETEQENPADPGSMIKTVEIETTKEMKFNAGSTEIYSGSDLKNMDFAKANIKNNIYLKYNDSVTNDFNAVATGLPFYILDETRLKQEYYGGTPLKIADTSKYSIDNESDIVSFWTTCPDYANMTDEHYNFIYNKLYNTLKSRIVAGTSEVAVVGCSGSSDERHLTLDKHKIMYIGVAFYNPGDQMIPINMIFNASYTVATEGGINQTYDLPHALSHFFPRDSMLYMAGKSYRQKVLEEASNKIKFNSDKDENNPNPLYISADAGAHVVQGTSKGGQDAAGNISTWSTSLDEVINIGQDAVSGLTAAEIQGLPTSEISANSRSEENGLYGILNKYSGVVEYVASSNELLSDKVIPTPDSIKAYFTSVKGKCIKTYQNICFFPNRDGNIKQWIL